MQLAQALRLNPAACLALVGSGGKTTALFQLAGELPGPVILTATAHLALEQAARADRHLIAASPADLTPLDRGLPAGITLVTGPVEAGRTQSISPQVQVWLRDLCREHRIPLLIEADGSRQRPLKAPAAHEPPIPEFVETVVVVAGLSALGHPLTEAWVHRPELFAELGGLSADAALTPEALARVLVHPHGGLKNVPPGAHKLALLNQADTPELQSAGRRLAERLLPAYAAVVIASLGSGTIAASLEPAAGIVLAAGQARRFGSPKQLLDYHGEAFVHAVARSALEAGLSPVVVVTGAQAEAVAAALAGLPVVVAHNPDWQSGQASSIRAGLAALPAAAGSATFLLADQPQVGPEVLRALVERHAADLPPILAPLVADRRANPVLFDRQTFAALGALQGDVGGRAIFSQFPVRYLPWLDESLLIDVDTPDDLAKLKRS